MTRRLLCRYAEGSTTGAGGIGAAAPSTAGAATGAAELHPQGAEAQPLSQAIASQQLLLRLNSLASRPPQLFLLPQPQPLSQAAISQPQLGAAPQGSQAAISQPQVGAAPQGSHAVSQPQVGSQAEAQPLSQQELFLQRSLANSSIRGRRRGLLQPESHPHGSQAAISQP
ncbi:MAG TPA: hypothetical protein DDW52_10860, partial [Planctomycetaceae bacterium]|nr:hypothetical protein [Planctomycetaceae bacterium]